MDELVIAATFQPACGSNMAPKVKQVALGGKANLL
jgi:hypothetical protein